eukprot:2231786-Prymnesium_polylepis.1
MAVIDRRAHSAPKTAKSTAARRRACASPPTAHRAQSISSTTPPAAMSEQAAERDRVVVVHQPRGGAALGVYDDVLKSDARHRQRRVGEDDARAVARRKDGDVAKRDAVKLACRAARAARARKRRQHRPAERARVCEARVRHARLPVGLLRRPDPNRPLCGRVDDDALVGDSRDAADARARVVVAAAELEVEPLERVPQHVLRRHPDRRVVAALVAVVVVGNVVLDGDRIVLRPDLAVVDVHVAAGNVEAVRVERRQVDKAVAQRVRAARDDAAVADHKAVDILEEGGPEGRVGQQQPLDHDVRRVAHGQQAGPALAVQQVADARDRPPRAAVAIEHALPHARGQRQPVGIPERQAGAWRRAGAARPRARVRAEAQRAIDLHRHVAQADARDAAHHVEDARGNEQRAAGWQPLQRCIERRTIVPRCVGRVGQPATVAHK